MSHVSSLISRPHYYVYMHSRKKRLWLVNIPRGDASWKAKKNNIWTAKLGAVGKWVSGKWGLFIALQLSSIITSVQLSSIITSLQLSSIITSVQLSSIITSLQLSSIITSVQLSSIITSVQLSSTITAIFLQRHFVIKLYVSRFCFDF